MSEPREPTIGLIVPLAEADAFVRAAQRRFEPSGSAANLAPDLVAAHVTVLWPFVPPNQLDEQVFNALEEICARFPRHAFTLDRLAAFPGGTVYLPPVPSAPLLELMRAVWERWPKFPPYGGMYEEVTPHVSITVAANDPALARQVTSFAEPFLPIHAQARELQVCLIGENVWTVLRRFALSEPSAQRH